MNLVHRLHYAVSVALFVHVFGAVLGVVNPVLKKQHY